MTHPPSISVVIPAVNTAAMLPTTLRSVGSDICEIIVADGGSTDEIFDIDPTRGVLMVRSEKGRGQQLSAGAAAASGNWLLFLHADSVLPEDWFIDASTFAADPENTGRAAVFTFALDDLSPQARRVERLVAWRTRRLGLPYGDQGLLISRQHYDHIGGFYHMPLMEDVDIIRRIGRPNIRVLPACVVTSADRYRRGGWWMRPIRNICCLALYFLRVPPRILVWLYQ